MAGWMLCPHSLFPGGVRPTSLGRQMGEDGWMDAVSP